MPYASGSCCASWMFKLAKTVSAWVSCSNSSSQVENYIWLNFANHQVVYQLYIFFYFFYFDNANKAKLILSFMITFHHYIMLVTANG